MSTSMAESSALHRASAGFWWHLALQKRRKRRSSSVGIKTRPAKVKKRSYSVRNRNQHVNEQPRESPSEFAVPAARQFGAGEQRKTSSSTTALLQYAPQVSSDVAWNGASVRSPDLHSTWSSQVTPPPITSYPSVAALSPSSSRSHAAARTPPDPLYSSSRAGNFFDVALSTTGSFSIPESPYFALRTPDHGVWQLQSVEEARAFRHYVQELSVELDVCDPFCHFSRKLPLLAASSPMITHAILAFASRSQGSNGHHNRQAVQHYSQCLERLIPALDDPLSEIDDHVLATVLLLRKYEENDELDSCTHHGAVVRLTNGMSLYARSGGMREAASWISLRQDLYVALTLQRPMSVDLDNYIASESLKHEIPEAIANRAVLNLAHVLNFCFVKPEQREQMTRAKLKETWLDLKAMLDDFQKHQPWHATPLWPVEEGAINHQLSGNGPADAKSWFPEILMCQYSHVIALQYYSVANLMLTLYDPSIPQLGLGARRKQMEAEQAALRHLRVAVGLATSNPQAQNAMYMACHVIMVCESYFTTETERRAAMAFIIHSKASVGWPKESIVEKLRQLWSVAEPEDTL